MIKRRINGSVFSVPLTRELAWTECLRMWKEITELGDYDKFAWLDREGYDTESIRFGCFLCEYDEQMSVGKYDDEVCKSCPAFPAVYTDDVSAVDDEDMECDMKAEDYDCSASYECERGWPAWNDGSRIEFYTLLLGIYMSEEYGGVRG